MLVAVLLGTIAVMNASGQLKDLKSMIVGMNSSKEIQTDGDDTVKIIDVAGNVETTANSDINNSSEMQTQDRDSQSIQEQTSDINSTENQSDEKILEILRISLTILISLAKLRR